MTEEKEGEAMRRRRRRRRENQRAGRRGGKREDAGWADDNRAEPDRGNDTMREEGK